MSSVAAAEAGLASTAVVAVAVVVVSTVGDGTRPQSVNTGRDFAFGPPLRSH